MKMRAWAWGVLAAVVVLPVRAADAGDAELALRLGLRRLAFERASAAMEALDPGAERDRAFLLAAAAKEGEGSPEDVLAWLRTVGAPPPASDWFRGRALCALGRPEEAAGILKDLLSRLEDDDPLRASVAADCARALSLSGSDREAALVLTGGGSGGGPNVSAFALAAGIDAGREPPDDVPDSLRALACAAAAVLRARAGSGPPPDEALALAARAVSLAADDPPALSECRGVELGLLAAAGRSKDAVDAARRLVAGDRSGGASEAVLSASSSLLASGDAASALALADLHDASFSDPAAESDVQRLRALSLEALGRASEAVAAWDAAAVAAAGLGDGAAAAAPPPPRPGWRRRASCLRTAARTTPPRVSGPRAPRAFRTSSPRGSTGFRRSVSPRNIPRRPRAPSKTSPHRPPVRTRRSKPSSARRSPPRPRMPPPLRRGPRRPTPPSRKGPRATTPAP